MSLYPPPRDIATHVFVDVVEALQLRPRTNDWVLANYGRPIHSFLEGPSFDRDGNLWCVNPPFGQVLKISPQRQVSVACTYDGVPGGLKIHRSGEIFIADRRKGLMRLDPVSGRIATFLGRDRLEPGYKGLNDLVFARNGDLYFTDQGDTGLQDPSGRVFRLRADGRLDCLLDNVPSPNGIVLAPAETYLFVAVTFGPQVWRGQLMPDGRIIKVGAFQTLSGGYSGPDGLAMDQDGGLAVCHNRLGTVWTFDPLGQPRFRIRSCRGLMTTNLAYGGPDNRTLYITESESGSILAVDLPVPGQPMFSHLP